MKSRKLLFYALVHLESQSRVNLVIFSVLLVLILGAVDYLTGFKLTILLFYLLPVSIVSWEVGPLAGLSISALSTLTWGLSNILAGEAFSGAFIVAWNAVTMLFFFIAMSLVLSALRRSLDDERHLARTDPLTGVLNRRAFYEFVNTHILFSQSTPPGCTLVYLDLDNFKMINDTFGHSVGDIVLVTAVDTIALCLGSEDILARMGGDEFIILTMETEPQALTKKMAWLYRELTATMQAQEWPITFSIGVLSFHKPAASVSQMITLVDRLMYQVKSTSKNGVAYAAFPDDFPNPSAQPRVKIFSLEKL